MLPNHVSILSIAAMTLFMSCGNRHKCNVSDSSDVSTEVRQPLSDSLSMRGVWDYYPQSAKTVSLTLSAGTESAFDDGCYKISAIDDPASPDDMDVTPSYSKIIDTDDRYEQTVILNLGSHLPAGRYRVVRLGTSTICDTLYADFEIVDKKGVKRIKDIISDYFMNKDTERNDTVLSNVYSFGIINDTIDVDLSHDSPCLRAMFYRDVVSYSALKFTGPTHPAVYTGPVVTDTLGVSMSTVLPVYPDTVNEVEFVIHNNSGKELNYGTPYTIARLVDGRWTKLYQNSVWDMPLFMISSGGSSELMTATLLRPLNEIVPGEYLIYKDVNFAGERESGWTISARFSIR